MSKKIKTILFSVIAVILIEIIAVIAGVYFGIPDVAASKPEGRMMKWFLGSNKGSFHWSESKTLYRSSARGFRSRSKGIRPL